MDKKIPSGLMLDAVRVRQCVSNLVSNAIKFTTEGEIQIVASCDVIDETRNEITIHVSDTGCGIDEEKRDGIFDSFSQADGSITRQFGGTGLGLSITRRLARMMGGDVSVVSEPGRGSIFTLRFQAENTGQNRLEIEQPRSATVSPSSGSSLTGSRALVVDDNRVNLRVARVFLEQHGLQVVCVDSGAQALEVLNRDVFDVVLMDIHMPGIDGTEALRRLRLSQSRNRLVPVIALTADSMRGDREKFLALGFDGYVSKPVDERDLISAIGQTMYIINDNALRKAG
jgi:CheY-like chemotaxis protein/anti-sigma regulatory factor (Ser/Thr protein kinase)